MQDRNAFFAELKKITPPSAPVNTDTLAYDFLLLFAILPTIPKTVQTMKDRGIPEEIRNRTLEAYDNCINITYNLYGKPGLNFRIYLI